MLVHQRRIHLAICIALAGLLFFLVGSVYNQPWFQTFDEWVQAHLYDAFGSSGRTVFGIITYLGSAKVSYPVMIMLMGVLITQKRYWLTCLLGLNLLGVRSWNWLLKAIYERPRPEIAHLVQVNSDSFPSGHAMNSAAFFGFLAFLLFQALKRAAQPYWWFGVSAAVLIGLIGLSRIYLGVHYPSDVAGGLLAGGAWLLFSMFLYTYIPERERFNQPPRETERDE